MYSEFMDKVVLVTGGNSGIGKAVAFGFAKNGAKVIITGRDQKRGETVVVKAKELGWSLEFIKSDVSNAGEVKNLLSYIMGKYAKLDIAFNNAGTSGETGKLTTCSLENWHYVIQTNLNGVFYCMKYQIGEMLKTGGGAIINNISVSGHRGYANGPAYVSSKHGLVGLTKSAAMGYADQGIRINGISPGLIDTPMTDKDRQKKPGYDEWVKKVEPIGRMGEPEEVAQTVLWLASAQASFITGHILAVDGGILAC